MSREKHADFRNVYKGSDGEHTDEEQIKKPEPVFHWLTREETIAGQKPDRRGQIGAGYADPTANTAIGHVYRLEMREKRKKVKKSDGKERKPESETATGCAEKESQVEGGDPGVQD